MLNTFLRTHVCGVLCLISATCRRYKMTLTKAVTASDFRNSEDQSLEFRKSADQSSEFRKSADQSSEFRKPADQSSEIRKAPDHSEELTGATGALQRLNST